MTTLEERVTALENTLVNKQELREIEVRLESRLYTVRDEIKGHMATKDDLAEMAQKLTAAMAAMEQRLLEALHSNGKGPG